MSGGIAYVLDEDDTFKSRCNMAMVELEPVPEEGQVAEQEFGHYNDLEAHGRVDVMADLTSKDAERLRMLISNHARYTNSKRAAEILADWPCYHRLFRKVMPVEYRRALAEMAKEKNRFDAGGGISMGKITGFLEIERHDRVYAPVEELCVPKTSSGDDFGFRKQNPCSCAKIPCSFEIIPCSVA
jgi:hypothetical protein